MMCMCGFTLSGVEPQRSVEKFVVASGIDKGSIAVTITDLATGMTIGEHNADSALIPASIMKSVTTAALLEEVGENFRYHTPVYIDGPLDMGILRGNLIIEGGCDPSLGSVEEPCGSDIIEEITEMLKNMGIGRIEGEILIDESGFAGPSRPSSWHPGDFSASYGTGSHAFNYRNNASGRQSVERPGDMFVSRLKAGLREAGIIIDDKDLGDGKREKILDHVSPAIDEIMRSCMMRSDNLFAECLLRTYGKMRGSNGSTSQGAALEAEMWRKKKMPMKNVEIIDGSGLSRSNRVTADFMTAVLKSMSDNVYYASFFPLAGQEGTLKSFLADTELEGYIAMKTGSMKGIQCYAGYKLDDDYAPTHSIVIIMNNITGSRDKAKKAAQQMLLEIFGENDAIETGSDE